eukprot:COSAG02_NODE_35595_length_466_cov_0.784741_1_plen_69_part_10
MTETLTDINTNPERYPELEKQVRSDKVMNTAMQFLIAPIGATGGSYGAVCGGFRWLRAETATNGRTSST